VFDQQNLVCANWFDVDCEQSVALFLNDFGHKTPDYADDDVHYEDEYEDDPQQQQQQHGQVRRGYFQ
jgi:hypothetical protein